MRKELTWEDWMNTRKSLSGLADRRRGSRSMSSLPTTPVEEAVVIDVVDETTVVEIVVIGETDVTTVVIDVTTTDEITSPNRREEVRKRPIWRVSRRLSSPLSHNKGSFLHLSAT